MISFISPLLLLAMSGDAYAAGTESSAHGIDIVIRAISILAFISIVFSPLGFFAAGIAYIYYTHKYIGVFWSFVSFVAIGAILNVFIAAIISSIFPGFAISRRVTPR